MRRSAVWLAIACSTASATAAAGPELPCRAALQVEPATPYVEQAVQWRLKIESRASVKRIEWIEAPAFPNARAERVTILPETRKDTGWRLRREERVVFPERAGPLRLPAARLACATHEKRHELQIASRILEVLPLPKAGRPPDFSGLIGPVTLRRYLRPETLALGGSARITVSLRGTGNVWAAADPHRNLALEDAELFRLAAQTSIERGGGLRVTKVFEADVVPRRSGVLRLPELRMSWFDPETGHYRADTVPALELRVAERPGARLRRHRRTTLRRAFVRHFD